MNIITIIPSNIEITVALISAGTTIFLFILTGIGRFFYTRYSLNYKLKKEYNFEQRKSIKVNLARSKTPLIKAAEELNYRLWNLSDNIIIKVPRSIVYFSHISNNLFNIFMLCLKFAFKLHEINHATSTILYITGISL